MTTFVRAPEAARQLGVSTATLYSYVSRGRVTRKLGADGRSSLFDLAELEALREKTSRPQSPPPTIDVRIASSVTQLDEDGLRYRDTPVDELVDRPYEDVCALLWQRTDLDLRPTRGAAPVVGSADWRLMGLIGLVTQLELPDDPFAATATVLSTIPGALGGSVDPDRSYADRLARAWIPEPGPELIAAINSTLVLLADHELATSTLAVRVAASVRASPGAAIIAGLATIEGDLHGSASHHVHRLLADCERDGANEVLAHLRADRQRVAGFGHSVYRRHDPRFDLLLDRVRQLPDPAGRRRIVDDLLACAGRYVAQLPNVDLALGAMTFVADLPPGCPLFAVARLAGWAAHYREEIDERPLRYRGLSY